jgi:hypothetical protein
MEQKFRMKKIFLIAAFSVVTFFTYGQVAIQNKEGKWGFADKNGKILIPYKYDLAFEFSEDLAPVKLDGKWGYIDKNNQIIIPFKFDVAEIFKEGLASVCLNDAFGFIDSSGKIIIPLKYIDSENFYQGKAYVQITGEKGEVGDRNTIEWIFIDKTGKKIN